ncbi:MAG: gamma-glutamyl-gamma-aminobutyrate hydrolase family protein [Ruminococcaceae bacterium]|jgi:putative glutamine amidotransferase|nr:gamma-glutamyl-gamma-aminobutyrate hydrolase family protein [Oscillospiraceae bacterium]
MPKIFLGWDKRPFRNYVNALAALGAEIERTDLADCDALLLPGGADIHPGRYGQDFLGSVDVDEARDQCEWALFRLFLEKHRPILGVCRGAQLINAALGGTLHQHIEGHSRLADGTDSMHAVHTDDPLLRSLYGERFTVNSAHHQAVDRLGNGLRAVAWADDGTIEAIRHETLPIFGVQWHPERLHSDDCSGDALLKAFLNALC